jgi:hypothetical protein
MFVPVRTLLTAGALVFAAAALPAQTDYRNLDDERPVRSEDAWALEFRAWEWMMPFHYARHAGRGEVEFTPEVMWGAFPNGLLGIKLPFRASDRLSRPQRPGRVSLHSSPQRRDPAHPWDRPAGRRHPPRWWCLGRRRPGGGEGNRDPHRVDSAPTPTRR